MSVGNAAMYKGRSPGAVCVKNRPVNCHLLPVSPDQAVFQGPGSAARARRMSSDIRRMLLCIWRMLFCS